MVNRQQNNSVRLIRGDSQRLLSPPETPVQSLVGRAGALFRLSVPLSLLVRLSTSGLGFGRGRRLRVWSLSGTVALMSAVCLLSCIKARVDTNLASPSIDAPIDVDIPVDIDIPTIQDQQVDASGGSNVTLQYASNGGLAMFTLLAFIFFINGRRWRSVTDRLIGSIEEHDTRDQIKKQIERHGLDVDSAGGQVFDGLECRIRDRITEVCRK